MTSKPFLPLTEVFVNSNKLLEQFIAQVCTTVENHIAFVDDKVTKDRWNDLVCNGINKSKPMTTAVLATILDVTDEKTTHQMGTLVKVLFAEVPILKNYWDLTKANQKSFYVKRLPVTSNMRLLSQITKQQESTKKADKVQTTLTQSPPKADANLDSMIMENMETFQNTSPTKIYQGKDNVDDDGFKKPKKPSSFFSVK